MTPTRTEIIIMATRTQNVLGEKGRRIRELTSVVQKRFNFPEGTVELYAEKVQTRGLCAIAQVLMTWYLFYCSLVHDCIASRYHCANTFLRPSPFVTS